MKLKSRGGKREEEIKRGKNEEMEKINRRKKLKYGQSEDVKKSKRYNCKAVAEQ